MNDRKAFLAAIYAAPDADMPRLAFADWLDEHAEHDRDRATAEFIRVSCLGRNDATPVMPKLAYPWIAENWQRLVPTVVSRHVAELAYSDHISVAPIPSNRKGRAIRASIRLPREAPDEHPSGMTHWYAMYLDFSRGFLRAAILYSPRSFRHLGAAVHIDQPFARLDCVGADDSVLRFLRGLVTKEVADLLRDLRAPGRGVHPVGAWGRPARRFAHDRGPGLAPGGREGRERHLRRPGGDRRGSARRHPLVPPGERVRPGRFRPVPVRHRGHGRGVRVRGRVVRPLAPAAYGVQAQGRAPRADRARGDLMIRFHGGPAAGQVLMLRRAPLFLRVVRNESGALDALDQLTDTPADGETVLVYRRIGEPGFAMIDWTEKGKRRGGCFACAEYRFVEPQPDQAVARVTSNWREWCYAEQARLLNSKGAT